MFDAAFIFLAGVGNAKTFSPYQKKLLTALAFLRGPSPKLGPNLWALRGLSPKLGPDLWALTGGTRLIPPNFLGVVRRLFRGRTDHILRHAGRPQWDTLTDGA